MELHRGNTLALITQARIMYKPALCLALLAGSALAQNCGDPTVASRLQPGMRSPEIRHKFDPPYPQDARDGISGTVKICFTIDTDGTPSHFSVTSSQGGVLDAAALNAIKQWEYIVTGHNGYPLHSQIDPRQP